MLLRIGNLVYSQKFFSFWLIETTHLTQCIILDELFHLYRQLMANKYYKNTLDLC